MSCRHGDDRCPRRRSVRVRGGARRVSPSSARLRPPCTVSHRVTPCHTPCHTVSHRVLRSLEAAAALAVEAVDRVEVARAHEQVAAQPRAHLASREERGEERSSSREWGGERRGETMGEDRVSCRRICHVCVGVCVVRHARTGRRLSTTVTSAGRRGAAADPPE